MTVGCPSSLNDILEVKLTEAMTVPLPEARRRRCLSLRARGDILGLVDRADAVVLGPGLGTHRETVALVRRLVTDLDKPLVLDADGLNALSRAPDLLRGRKWPTVITPHPGEFSRLTGKPISEIQQDPIGSARSFARSHRVLVVLKGAPTVISDSTGLSYVNPTGNAGMATGGSGDVLAGSIGALIGQGLSPEAGARLGVFLHGAAGDIARERRGEIGLSAGDLVEALPEAFERAAREALILPYFEAA